MITNGEKLESASMENHTIQFASLNTYFKILFDIFKIFVSFFAITSM